MAGLWDPAGARLHTRTGLHLLRVAAGAIAAVASLLLTTISTASLIVAAGLTALAAGLASLLVLVWPLQRLPAELLRDAA